MQEGCNEDKSERVAWHYISRDSGRYGVGGGIPSGGCRVKCGGTRADRGGEPPEVVREQIRETKKRTDKPFGVNVMLLNPNAPEVAKIVIEEGVKVVTTGAGSPAQFMDAWKAAGVTVIPVVASVAMAKLMQRAGADAVVAEGMEISARRRR